MDKGMKLVLYIQKMIVTFLGSITNRVGCLTRLEYCLL